MELMAKYMSSPCHSEMLFPEKGRNCSKIRGGYGHIHKISQKKQKEYTFGMRINFAKHKYRQYKGLKLKVNKRAILIKCKDKGEQYCGFTCSMG